MVVPIVMGMLMTMSHSLVAMGLFLMSVLMFMWLFLTFD